MMFGNMEEIMNMMGHGSRLGASRRRKGRDVGIALPVTLEDLYTGKKVSMPRDRTVLCNMCRGKGTTKPGAGGPCYSCNGHGIKIHQRQMGMMIQQSQAPCDVCGGEGSTIEPKDRCHSCQGHKVKTVSAPLSVKVEKGMEHQERIAFEGEGDQQPDVEPGSIVVVLQQQKHDRFARFGNDLVVTQKLSLTQALCGFAVVITHLDGRRLLIRNNAGTVFKSRDTKAIVGEGMPIRHDVMRRGDLIIEFEVEFPERLEMGSIELLRTVLPPPMPRDSVNADNDDVEVCYVNRQSMEEIRGSVQQDEIDEEEGGNNGGVQCAQQ